MAKRAGIARSPSDDDWRQAVDAFKRHRDLDGKKFREGVEQLIPELRHEAASAYDTAARRERKEPADLSAYDGSAVTLRLEKRGYAEQIALAALDLLHFEPSVMPTSTVVVVTPDEIAKGIIKDLAARILSGVDEQEVVRLLRIQAERLLEGGKRVQRCFNDYKQRLAAIEPATSVAWHALFETIEPWGSQPKDIAEQIALRVRHPRATEHIDHADHVALWHDNVRSQLRGWRRRRKPSSRRAPK